MMTQVQAGDGAAYRTLLDDIQPLIRVILRRWFSDFDELEDAAQETLLTLHRARHTYDPTRPFEARLLSEPGPRRIALLSAAATAVENPLHGCGLDCHPAQVRGIPMDAHFTPVNVAAVLGLPGLAALLWVIGRVWRERARPADIAVWCALLAVAIEALATDVEDFRHVWILFGLAMASLNGSANLEDRRIKFS